MSLRRLILTCTLATAASAAGAEGNPQARAMMRMICFGDEPGSAAFSLIVQQMPGPLDASWLVPGNDNYARSLPMTVPLDVMIFLETSSVLPEDAQEAARVALSTGPDVVARADGYRREGVLTAAWDGQAGWLEVGPEGTGVFRDAGLGLAYDIRCPAPFGVPER